MVAGLKKKARNSGEIASITGHVVYRRGVRRRSLPDDRGDEERIEHEPILDMDESEMVEANAIGAYAIGRLKDGTIIRAWRSKAQIYRAKSPVQGPEQPDVDQVPGKRAGSRPRSATRPGDLPSSTDKEGVDVFARAVERDDELYDFNNARTSAQRQSRMAAAASSTNSVETKQAAAEANGRGSPSDR